MSAWDENISIVRQRWPYVALEIERATLDQCATLMDTPQQALIYRNRQITSAFDSLDEAKRQAEDLKRDTEAVYCYGIGLGYLPAVMVARHELVSVVVMNATIARAALVSAKQQWLSAPHVELKMARDVPILYVPYACVPMECRMADQQGHALRDRLFAHINQRCINDFHFGVNAARDQKHVEDNNRQHMSVDRHVRELFGTANKRHIIIVGGGPTLASELDWLRKAKEEGAKVITASTSLRYLMQQGIKPDVCVCIDTEPSQVAHLDDVPDEYTANIHLVYHPTVFPGFVERWKGKRFYYVAGTDLYTSGTVMHPAADLAVKLGARRVTMLGCDFCYPGHQSHIPGVFDAKDVSLRPTMLETVDGNGNLAYTDYNLAQYHRHLEDYIARQDGKVKWFKRGRGGVSVRGVEWEA